MSALPFPLTDAGMPEASRTVFDEPGEKERKENKKELDEPEIERAGPKSESRERRREIEGGADHRIQSPEKQIPQLLLCTYSSPHGSELENYRDSAVELPATLAPATEARDSLRCPPKDASQGPGRLENPAVVNTAVALGFAKGPVIAGL